MLELLARTFPIVEILEVHKDLLDLVQEMSSDTVPAAPGAVDGWTGFLCID
jgi:hypothetical protein